MTKIKLYFDADAQRGSVVVSLRERGVDVQIANEAGLADAKDDEQLAYAVEQERTLYTFNVGHFLQLHAAYIAEDKTHAGIILAPQQRYAVGEQMRRLLRLVNTRTAEQMRNNIEFLSMWG